MPFFLDVHKLGGYSRPELEKSIGDGIDEFGVKVHQLLFNKDEDVLYCICEAPSKESIINHHKKFDCICDGIVETDYIKTAEMLKSEKLQAIGELAARIAHDLRNPLSVIKGSLEIMHIKNPELYKKSLDDFDRINKSMIRIMHQVDNVLDFVKPKQLRLEKMKICRIIENSLLKLNIPDGIKITFTKLDYELICDEEKLEIVFVNLISNAIQAINDKGKIDIRVFDNGQNIVIEIEDSGHGIPEHIVPRIFEPLFTTRQIGTGLGLPSCKTIVEQHGGKISVKTMLDKGTTFIIELPKL
ncbi:ATP-binding protein [Candidatus Nitrosotenuis sp. DW1]|uniref:ATP-binding protein n=1 Tax=Candidatus Nitrosotenuis sp. DW1 TaxID=2259672 RepID=UPI0015C79ECB|nr:ATP-binding protein [Candidatus Nitrosotenuis sp. DW1]QLH08133.1 histidine kinase [Candidatus Nitrosotenuis sp. DW1]